MKRRIFASLLALCLLAGLPVKALAAEDADNEQEMTAPAENIVQEPESETSPETCTLTEGCTLPAGHEGQCILAPADMMQEPVNEMPPAACTLTEGCTLPIGHEGDCVQPSTDTGNETEKVGTDAESLPDDTGAGVESLPDEEMVASIEGTNDISLSEALENANEGDTIDLCANSIAMTEALVVDKNITLTNGTLTRAGEYTGYLLTVSSGTLTLTDITLDGEDRMDIKNALIRVEQGGELVIGAGAVLQRNKNFTDYLTSDETVEDIDFAGGAYTYGGRIVLDGGKVTENIGHLGGGIGAYKGTITISSGEVSRNMAYWKGGGICAEYTDIDMTGGTITENTVGEGAANPVQNPKANGGGIYIAYDAKMTMSGGEITHNKALNWLGGGIFISGALAPAEFNMTGGSVNYNFAQVSGGGIYLECGTNAAMDGHIEVIGNEAKGISLANGWYYFGGGGIYVNGGVGAYPDATLTIKNVIVTKNTAAASGEYTGSDVTNKGYAYGYGSGLAACNTGDVKIYLTDGGAIYKNQSKSTASGGKYNDVQVYILKEKSGSGLSDMDLQISEYMLGGGSYNWMNWSGTKAVDLNTLSRVSTIFLNPKPDEDAIRAAETLGTIMVRDNQTDSMGGGVAVNGSLVIGTGNAGALSVHKTVSGGSASQEFTFTVKFTGDGLSDSYPCIVTGPEGTVETGKLALMDGTGTFKLKHDQTITITNLPKGTAFEVSESENIDYQTAVTSQEGTETTDSTIQGTIPEDATAKVSFTNTYDPQTGGLTVSKTVSGSGASRSKRFTFTVTLDDKSVSGKFGDMAFEKGEAVFELKHGQSATATGLPKDIGYSVKESGNGGYDVTAKGDTGTIPAGDIAEAIFKNYKDDDPDEPDEPDDPPEPPPDDPDDPPPPPDDPDDPDDPPPPPPDTPDTPDEPGDPTLDLPQPGVPQQGAYPPATGDNSIVWWAALLLSACGLAVLALLKKRGEA